MTRAIVVKRFGAPVVLAAGSALLSSMTAQANRSAELATTASITAQAAAAVLDNFNSAPRIAALGDSIIQTDHNPYGAATNMYGEFYWAQVLYPHFLFDVWRDDSVTAGLRYFEGLNQGYSGATSEEALDYVDKVLGMAPDVACVAIGVNDLGDGTAPAVTMANIETICERVTAAGIPVKLANIRPVAYTYGGLPEWEEGGTYQLNRLALNDLIEAYAESTPGVELVDLSAAYGGNQPADIANLLRDGLHPFPQGAWKGAQAWLAAIKHNVKALPVNSPLYVADTNAVSNGLFTGTGGEKYVVTGDVADNWFAIGNAAAVAASKREDGAQVFVIDPGAGSDTEQLRIQPGDSNYPEYLPYGPGNWLRAFCEIEISDWAGWQQFRLDGFGGSGAGYGVEVDALRNLDFDGPQSFTLITPPMIMPDSEEALPTLRVFFDGNGAGTGTIAIKKFWIGLVPDPRPLFGF